MSAQIFRKLGGTLSSSGTEGSAVISSGLGILVSERPCSAKTRQRIIDLYDRLRAPLRAYLCCLGMSADQTEDVIQDTFLRLVSHRFECDARDNPRAWVFRVAHNLSMDVHRRSRLRHSCGSDDEPRRVIRERVDPRPSPEQQVLLDERMKHFEVAFAQLTLKQRQCVLLRAEGFRYREIAHTLGISVQRVGELMQRSISLLAVQANARNSPMAAPQIALLTASTKAPRGQTPAKRALIMICAGLILFSVWRWQLPSVSAAEFLDRAVASDQNPPKIAGSGVIHRRFQIKTGKKTIEHDAYRDVSGRRQPRNDNVGAEDADLAGRLALAGVNWDDPLSAVSFKNWHDRQPNPKDEVNSSGEGLLTIGTRLQSTGIAQESLTVREDSFHPVERTIEYRDFGTVEISEVSLDILSWEEANQLLFVPPPESRLPVMRVPASAPALVPSMAQLDQTELETRLTLNQKSADTGEQIEVTRDGRGVRVQGLVEGEQRKRDLIESLQGLPFLSATIRSFEDLESTRGPTAQVTATQQQSAVAQVSPLEQYFVQHGRNRDDLSRISVGLFNCSLVIDRSSRSIEQIELRFSVDEDLSPAAIQARDELLSRTVDRLVNDLKEQQQFLAETGLDFESAAVGPRNPDADSLDLAQLAALNMGITRELISGSTESSRSQEAMAADLAKTISQLRTAALTTSPGHSSK